MLVCDKVDCVLVVNQGQVSVVPSRSKGVLVVDREGVLLGAWMDREGVSVVPSITRVC